MTKIVHNMKKKDAATYYMILKLLQNHLTYSTNGHVHNTWWYQISSSSALMEKQIKFWSLSTQTMSWHVWFHLLSEKFSLNWLKRSIFFPLLLQRGSSRILLIAAFIIHFSLFLINQRFQITLLLGCKIREVKFKLLFGRRGKAVVLPVSTANFYTS